MPQVGLVHDVVVHQARQVQQFHGGRAGDGPFAGARRQRPHGVRGREHQQWTQPFAAGEYAGQLRRDHGGVGMHDLREAAEARQQVGMEGGLAYPAGEHGVCRRAKQALDIGAGPGAGRRGWRGLLKQVGVCHRNTRR